MLFFSILRTLENFYGNHIDFILGAILLPSVGGTENERMSRLVTKFCAFKLVAKLYGNVPTKDLVHTTGINFTCTCTCSFYARRSRKRKKVELSHRYLFTLSGSVSIKAVRRTLMKLSPGVSNNYTN